MTREDFNRDVLPILGDFADSYDLDAIWRDATDDEGEWIAPIADETDADGYSETLNAIIASHVHDTARVYVWYDYDLGRWRYDLTPVSDEVLERVDVIELPEGFGTYEAQGGVVYATALTRRTARFGGDLKTIIRGIERGMFGTYKIVRDDEHDEYCIKGVTEGDGGKVYRCKTVAEGVGA